MATRSLRTHVAIEGPPGAPPLVLLHSLGTDLRLWDPQAVALSRSFRVIRPDLRGHGLSETTQGPYTVERLADDVLGLLEALEVRAAHVGGVSLGGMVAMALAHAAPERVRSLALFDTAMAIPPPESWLERARVVRGGGMETLADGIVARWVTPARTDSPEAKGLRAMLTRTPAEGYASSAEALAAWDFRERARTVRVPALVVVGDGDLATPVASAEAIRDALGGKLVVLEQAAHLPMLEKADTVTAALADFLRPSTTDAYELGLAVRKEVLGEEYVAGALAAITDLDRDFQAFLTRTAWGSMWARPGLDRRTRHLVTLALLAALGHTEEFEAHVRAMSNTGASPADLSEVLQQVAVYAGVPAANAAMRAAKKALKKEG
ncbi:3-oxoadipate enol-lactonase [Pendulispora rubella]|uniref:3-oxoadipate enol-lactonase n=1 Tax=Pendulispora rubella TaxID=2741070 RepID=A0ABZ2L7G9_9BACT